MQSIVEQRGGFAAQRTSPVGIGGAIAVHALVVGVFLLMPKEVIDRITPGPIWVTSVPLPKPPPEPPKADPKQEKTIRQPADDRFVIPDPVFPDLPKGDPVDITGGGTIILPGDGGAVPADPPHVPVLADAAPDPRYARDFQPDYPSSMQRMQEEGKVTVRVRIGTDGRVLAVERLFAASDAFWEATERQALRKWRFRPATRDGVPVEAVRTMTVHFRLD